MSSSPFRRLAIAAFAALPLAAAAAPAQAQMPTREQLIEETREEQAFTDVPRKLLSLPAGKLRLPSAEFLAGVAPQTVRFEVHVERDVRKGAFEITLPAAWTRTAESGLPFAKAPKAGRTAGGKAKLDRSGRTAVLRLDGAKAGDVASVDIEDVGIAAGTYSLPYGWRYASGRLTRVGTAKVVFYAPAREAVEEGAEGRFFNPGQLGNVTQNSYENSEPFVAVSPGDPQRIAVGTNDNSGASNRNSDGAAAVWVTSNGGRKWRKIVMNRWTKAYGAAPDADEEYQNLCCDPAFASDRAGNIWFSLISHAPGTSGGAPSRIVVNRIAQGEEFFQDYSTGLPARTAGTQDKQMMTIDNTPSSPTYGRLYIAWNEPRGGGVTVVISQCDTRVARIAQPERCDDPNNWTRPAPVVNNVGSFIYADVAVGPDGRVYVTWQDFSATNAIRGTSCKPTSATATTCSNQVFGGWAAPQTIGQLDSTGGPVPFWCPTVHAPAGRTGPSPSVEVDHSGGSDHGRVYVAWADLRTGSGSTRCAYGVAPSLTHLSWDSFVASKQNALPGGAARSHITARRVHEDGTAKSEEFLPWLAVDHTTGQAWVSFYSTKGDPNRSLTHQYLRPVAPKGTNPGYGPAGNAMGPQQRVSVNPSDYSFGTLNDYGDYAGVDATDGVAVPVWVDNSLQPSEIATYTEGGTQRQPAGALAQASGLAGCWAEDPGTCSDGRSLTEPQSVAVSPDGKSVYVGTDGYWGSQSIVTLNRGASTGTLTMGTANAACTSLDGAATGVANKCLNGRGVSGVNTIAVSPDNKHVYTITDDGVAIFGRNTTSGTISQLAGRAGCITDDGTASFDPDHDDYDYTKGGYPIVCGAWRGFGYATPDGLTISPDGRFVYLTYGNYSSGVIGVFSRNATSGALTQVAGAAGCYSQDTTTGCTAVSLFANNGVKQLIVSPDGKSAYAAGYTDLIHFTRNASTGALTLVTPGGCYNEDGARSCVVVTGMKYSDRLAISPDGRFVYAGVADSFYGSVAVFQRNTLNGRLTQPTGSQKCVRFEDYYAADACTDLWNMYGVSSMQMSADGGSIYIGHGNGVTVLDRNPNTGALGKPPTPFGCVSEDGTDSSYLTGSQAGNCFDARGFEEPYAVAVAPDGKNVYAAAEGSNAVAVLSRRTLGPPACRSSRVAVGKDRARSIRLICTDDNQRPLTFRVATAPGKGTLGTIAADGKVTYTPRAGIVGEDSFTFTATNASGTSTAVRFHVTIG